MRVTKSSLVVYAFVVLFCITAGAQSPNRRKPDLSNKALITKSTPPIKAEAFKKRSLTAAIATWPTIITRGGMKIIRFAAARLDCTHGTIG